MMFRSFMLEENSDQDSVSLDKDEILIKEESFKYCGNGSTSNASLEHDMVPEGHSTKLRDDLKHKSRQYSPQSSSTSGLSIGTYKRRNKATENDTRSSDNVRNDGELLSSENGSDNGESTSMSSISTWALQTLAALSRSQNNGLSNYIGNDVSSILSEIRKQQLILDQTEIRSSSSDQDHSSPPPLLVKRESESPTPINSHLNSDSSICPSQDITNSNHSLLSDQDLLSYSPRELNKILKTLPKHIQRLYKQRRRTLKNRFYAQTCRVKRQSYRHQMELENARLKSEILKWQDAFVKLYQSYRSTLDTLEEMKKERGDALPSNNVEDIHEENITEDADL